MTQADFIRLLRSARWVDLPKGPPLPPSVPAEVSHLSRLHRLLDMLRISTRTILGMEDVRPATRDRKLAENADATDAVEARIAELGGGKTQREAPGLHSLG